MTAHFQFQALPREIFEPLLAAKNQKDLPEGVLWLNVDAQPGYPCRVSLEDAPMGSRVLALCHTHHNVNSPYRASGPIFVHENAVQALPAVNQIPAVCRGRDLSIRAYDKAGLMIDARTTHGSQLAETVGGLFANSGVDYLHVHNAGPGCFSCAVRRA